MTLESRFRQAAADAKSLPAQDNQNLLALYSLYKQSTQGDVSGPEPSAFDLRGKAKYQAWSALRGMKPEEAMRRYIARVEELGQSG